MTAPSTSGPGLATRPVGKIVAVGRNYAAHAAEMGAERPTEPLLFLKPPTALADDASEIDLPPWSTEIHHEVELVLRIGLGGASVSPEFAARQVDAAAVGVDLTARDVQQRAKERGHPWAVAKGFDGAAPLGGLKPVAALDELRDLRIGLEVDGQTRQSGRTSEMLWSPAELIAFISRRFRLVPGDLIYTGTPSGVGPLFDGEAVSARLEGHPTLRFRCRHRPDASAS